MTRTERFQMPSRAILLGISLQLVISLAAYQYPNDSIHAQSSDTTVDRSNGIKIHQKQQNQTNQTTLASDPTGPLLVDPNHGLERTLSPAQILSGSLAVPTERPTAPLQGELPYQGLSGNMTVYLPTPTLVLPTSTANVSYAPLPTPIANITATNSSYNDSTPIAPSTMVTYVTVDPSSSTPTPAQVAPLPSTSTTIVYATAPPTISNPSSSGGANTSGAYSLSASLSLTVLMASVTTAMVCCILFGQ